MKQAFEKIEPTSSLYPRSIRDLFGGLLPPALWYAGNINLLDRPGVGFCGSRKATEDGLEIAADCARQLSEHEVTVISGYAPGVDTASHESALASGGSTIIVLPEGIDHFRIKKSLRDSWDWSRLLVLSYFPPSAVWRADRAMDRNKAIVALSNAVVVIEAGETGGTLNAGFTALRANKPLFVVSFAQAVESREGNAQLLRDGGIPLLRSKSTGRPHLRRLLDELGDGTAFSSREPSSVHSSH